MNWSLESYYSFIYTTDVHAKKIENAKKTNENKNKKR